MVGAPRRPWWTVPLRLGAERPWLVTAVLCLVTVGLGLHGPDSPAQDFRTWMFRHHGLLIWNDQWYGGHLVTGYSPLFPPLAALLGNRVVGSLSCVASTVLATRLLRRGAAGGHTVGLLWFAVVIVADLVVGRGPFALGLALALGAVLSVRARRPVLGAVCALLCSLASPLAGAFLLLAGLAWAPTLRWRPALPLGTAAIGLVIAALFGEQGGRFPFPLITLLAVLAFVLSGLLLAPAQHRALRLGLALYGGSALVLFLVPNPVGGNVARLGSLLAGPVAALVLMHAGRRRVLATLTLPLLIWQLAPVTSALADAHADASSRPAYYANLLDWLSAHQYPVGRLEIPFTRSHWETAQVAPRFALARGWERQLDLTYNAILYKPGLTAEDYHAWLLDNGVRFVALPDVPLDRSSVQEAAVVESQPPWLRPAWSDAHWRVWEVTDPQPLLSGDGRLTRMGVGSFDVTFNGPGVADVLVHYNRFWRVAAGNACVQRSPDGWTEVVATSPGPVTVAAQLSLGGLPPGSAATCP